MRRLVLIIVCASMALVAIPGRKAVAATTGTGPWAIGVDLRERGTYVSGVDFDSEGPHDDWLWTQRLTLGADYQPGRLVSGRFVLVSAIEGGGEGSPVERNLLDLQEAWLRFGTDELSFKLGRQELRLGSQRLVGWRDGTNVRRTWDGARGSLRTDGWTVDTFVLRLVDVDPNGAFNDSSDNDRMLAGAYATGAVGWTGLDVYYLYSRADDRTTIEGTANQDRHSVGARSFGDFDRLFWNWEAVYQFGRHGRDDIRAWTVATNTGLKFDAAWSPELMLSANVASGDSEPGDGKLETFDALYPRGNYFSELALLGPANFVNLNPDLTVRPTDDLAVSFDVNWYWRLETSDGVYGPPGNILRGPGSSDERFVNTALSLAIEWQARSNLAVALSLTHSRPEAFIADTGPADIVNFAEFTVQAGF